MYTVHSRNFFTFHGVEDLCRIKSSPARAAENSLVGGIHWANKHERSCVEEDVVANRNIPGSLLAGVIMKTHLLAASTRLISMRSAE